MHYAPIFALAIFGAALGGCSRARDAGAGARASEVRLEDGGTAVDLDLMAFLSEARALHHQANVKEEAGDIAGAIAAMQQLVRASRPHPDERLPEIDEVLADAYARLAELQVRAHDVDSATASIREGMTYAPDPTYFRGHLLEVAGIAEETRASLLADAGKAQEAAQARARALASLQQAVDVQEQVITRAIGDAGRNADDARVLEGGRK
jgi:tetratricopeptide (TPR) repeat protein